MMHKIIPGFSQLTAKKLRIPFKFKALIGTLILTSCATNQGVSVNDIKKQGTDKEVLKFIYNNPKYKAELEKYKNNPAELQKVIDSAVDDYYAQENVKNMVEKALKNRQKSEADHRQTIEDFTKDAINRKENNYSHLDTVRGTTPSEAKEILLKGDIDSIQYTDNDLGIKCFATIDGHNIELTNNYIEPKLRIGDSVFEDPKHRSLYNDFETRVSREFSDQLITTSMAEKAIVDGQIIKSQDNGNQFSGQVRYDDTRYFFSINKKSKILTVRKTSATESPIFFAETKLDKKSYDLFALRHQISKSK